MARKGMTTYSVTEKRGIRVQSNRGRPTKKKDCSINTGTYLLTCVTGKGIE